MLIGFAFWSGAGKTQVIPVDSVQDYLGKNVTVYGRVVEASFNYAKKKDTSVFKMNDVATGKTLSLIITPEVRATFGYRPENVLLNKLVYINGVPQKNDLLLQMQISGPFDISFSPERFSEKSNETAIQQLPADVIRIMIQADEVNKKSVIEVKGSAKREYPNKADKPEGQKSINTAEAEKMTANNPSLKKEIKEEETPREALNKAEEAKKVEQKRANELAAQAQKDEESKKEALRKEEEYKAAMKKATEISAQIRKEEEDTKKAELAAKIKKNEEAAKDSLRQEEELRKTEQKKKDVLAEKTKDDEAAIKEALRKEEEYKEALKKSAEIAAKNRKEEEARKEALEVQLKKEEEAKNEALRKAAEQQKEDDLAAQPKKNEEAKKAEAINEKANEKMTSQGEARNNLNTKSNNQSVKAADKNDDLVGKEIILKTGVSLKGGPGGFFLTIGSFTKGEIVKIISCSFDWCKIALAKPLKGKNIEGYVKADKLL